MVSISFMLMIAGMVAAATLALKGVVYLSAKPDGAVKTDRRGKTHPVVPLGGRKTRERALGMSRSDRTRAAVKCFVGVAVGFVVVIASGMLMVHFGYNIG